MPDIWAVADQVQPAFEELRELAGVRDPTIVKSAAPVTRTVDVTDANGNGNGAPKRRKQPTKKAKTTKKATGTTR